MSNRILQLKPTRTTRAVRRITPLRAAQRSLQPRYPRAGAAGGRAIASSTATDASSGDCAGSERSGRAKCCANCPSASASPSLAIKFTTAPTWPKRPTRPLRCWNVAKSGWRGPGPPPVYSNGRSKLMTSFMPGTSIPRVMRSVQISTFVIPFSNSSCTRRRSSIATSREPVITDGAWPAARIALASVVAPLRVCRKQRGDADGVCVFECVCRGGWHELQLASLCAMQDKYHASTYRDEDHCLADRHSIIHC